MSRIALRHRSLQQIVALRRLNEARARSDAAMATKRADQAETQRTTESEGVRAAEADWLALFERGNFDPGLVEVRARALDRQCERLAAAEQALAEEESKRREASQAQVRATAQFACANALLQRARFKFDLWREEATLAELSDVVAAIHIRTGACS